MPVMMIGNRRNSGFGGSNNHHFGHNNSSSCCDSTRRVKVFDSRRKQRWVDPILTPPRSPQSPQSPATDDEIPEPILDDIFGLWDGAGLQELGDIITDEFGQELNVASALSELDMGFDNEFLSSSPIPFPPGDSISDDDDGDQLGEQLDRLLNYVSDNSPPPTNPPSPPGDLDSTYCSSGSSSCNSSQYDEGFIGEDLINEQPDIFDNPICSTDTSISFTTNIFEEDLGIKNDCMWGVAPSIEDLQHTREELIKEFGAAQIKMEVEDENEMKWTDTLSGFWNEEPASNSHASSSSSNEQELKYSEELEIIRHGTLNDHTYANPFPSDVKKELKLEKNHSSSNYSNNSSKRNQKSNHTIPGIIIKEEADSEHQYGPKKTKILVPLKDLMESLQQKTFLVAPLGPGKKVIRLTGKETVKGMLGVHTNFSNHLSGLSQHSSFGRPMLNHSQFANKLKMKKAKAKLVKERLAKLREEASIVSSTTFVSPSSPSSVVPLKPKKTKTHNNMERLRRIDLRNSFENLKKLVPILAKSSKCSKVEILRRAEEYVKGIRNLERKLVREETIVRNRNEALKLKLAQLQSQGA